MRLIELLTIEKFENWLNAQNPNVIVGLARHSCKCPLANYLRACEFLNPAVSYKEVFCADSQELMFYLLALPGEEDPDIVDAVTTVDYLPSWICHFVELIDGQDKKEVSVSTAKEALLAVKAYM